MFDPSEARPSPQSVISSAMVRGVLMRLVAVFVIVVGSIVGLLSGADASSSTAVKVPIARLPSDAARADFAQQHWVRGEVGSAEAIEVCPFAAAQAGGPSTSLPGRSSRRSDSIIAAIGLASLVARTSTFGYDAASGRTTPPEFVATNTPGAAGESAGVDLTKGGRDKIGTLEGDKDKTVADAIRERGGGNGQVRDVGHWGEQTLGEAANAAAAGDKSAEKAVKGAKQAGTKGQRKY